MILYVLQDHYSGCIMQNTSRKYEWGKIVKSYYSGPSINDIQLNWRKGRGDEWQQLDLRAMVQYSEQ